MTYDLGSCIEQVTKLLPNATHAEVLDTSAAIRKAYLAGKAEAVSEAQR